MDINEKSAYIKGLFEGFGIDGSKPEGKLIGELIELVTEMSEKIHNLEVECRELRDFCEELDEDLGEVEESLLEEDEYDDEDDDDFFEVTCPACGETVCFDEDVEPEDLACPACGEKFDATCDPEKCASCEGCAEKTEKADEE